MTHSQPGSGHEQHAETSMSTPATTGASQPAPAVSTEIIAAAMRQEERARGRRRIGRRALLGAAGVGLCCGAAALAPAAATFTEQQVQEALQRGIEKGIEQGRQAALNELRQLGDVSITAAVDVAELTRAGLNAVLLPMTKFTTTITADALAALSNAVQGARDTLAHFNVTIAQLDDFHALLLVWATNVRALPTALDVYANTDITQSERYLKELKRRLDAQPAGTPTSTSTS